MEERTAPIRELVWGFCLVGWLLWVPPCRCLERLVVVPGLDRAAPTKAPRVPHPGGPRR